jgi:hypothetical protein
MMKKLDLIGKTRQLIKQADQNVANFEYLSSVTWSIHQLLASCGKEKLCKNLRQNYAKYRMHKTYSRQMVPVLERAYVELVKI